MLEVISEGLTFNDVLILPKYSDIKSRKSIDTKSRLAGNLFIKCPIISANMDTVTEFEMAVAMDELGGVGVIHRFLSIDKHIEQLSKLNGLRIASIGVKEDDLKRMSDLNFLIDAVLIDVAHGHSKRVIELIKKIKKENPDLPIIAGNVATYEGASALILAGADAIKVGVGPGAVCTTRIVTGCGVPQVTAIMEARRALNDYIERCNIFNENPRPVAIIADGGIKNSGDAFKALVAGADTVMIGSLFAGTEESPGQVFETPDGSLHKSYRGMASKSAQASIGVDRAAEGVETSVPYKGPVAHIFNELMDGIRSGMSYVGSNNMEHLKNNKIKMVKMSSAGYMESRPHALDKH